MSAGARGGLSLVTTDPMDATGQPDPNNIPQGPTGALGQQQLGPTVPNPLNRPTSQRSELYSSIITSIFRALREDETFECLIEKEQTGLELVPILVAIRYHELTGELSKTEATELITKCEGCMLEAATAKKRKHRVGPKDIYRARMAAEAVVLNKKSHINTYELLQEAIAEGNRSGNFMCLIETDVGFEERPVLEAILWARKKGKITDQEAHRLSWDYTYPVDGPSINRGGAMELIRIHAAGLLKGETDACKLCSAMQLPQEEIDLFEEELAAIGVVVPTTTTRASTHSDWQRAAIPAGKEEEPIILTGDRTRNLVWAAAAVAIIGAGIATTVKTGLKTPASLGNTKAPIAALNHPDVTDPNSLGSIIITISPDAKATESDTESEPAPARQAKPATPIDEAPAKPEAVKIKLASAVTPPPNPQTPEMMTVITPSKPTPITTTPETEAPTAVRIMTTQAQIQPEQPEAAQQTSINLPIATKPGTYGGVTLDEAASKKLWESAGWTVKARMGTGGKKVFVLSKNGRSFVTGDTNIAEGQTGITASAE